MRKPQTPNPGLAGAADPSRIVGVLALAMTAVVVIQNVVVGMVQAPDYGAPLQQVLTFHVEHRTEVAVAIGLEALHLPLLLGFVTGLHGLIEQRRGVGAWWSRLAMAGGAALAAVFTVFDVAWAATVVSAAGLTQPSPAFELAWRLHAAGLAMALPMLAVTFLGAAMATHASGLTPSWQRLVAVVGSGLLLVAGGATVAIADGSAVLFTVLPGYAAWFVWLVVTGVRLMRHTVESSNLANHAQVGVR